MQPFPGFPDYLDAAAAALGHPEAAAPARRIVTLSALANLCAQASLADEGRAAIILARAEEFVVQLQVAARAAEMMLADLRPGATPTTGDDPPAAIHPVRGDLSPKPARSSRPRGMS